MNEKGIQFKLTGPAFCCARCRKLIKADLARYKIGRFIYGACCILKAAANAGIAIDALLEQMCSEDLPSGKGK